MRIFTCMAACGLILCLSVANANQDITRFLIVGDSWAEEQWEDGSHARVFQQHGLEGVGISGELTTTSGSTAADWVMTENLERISAAFDQYPHLDTVQLTIGGNDFLDQWNTGMSQKEFDALIGFIQSDVEIVSNYILSLRPDIEIIISLYDYPNFEDTRSGLIWFFACSPLWNDLGQPSPLAVNTAAVAVIDAIESELIGNPRVSHVRHLGRAQNHFGLPDHPPGTIAPPGLLDQPSPAAAMRTRFIGGGLDCFHFNAQAYDVLIDNLVDGYIAERFQSGLSIELAADPPAYDGSPRPAIIDTEPSVEMLIVTYNGGPETPVNAGTYDLVVTAPGWRETLVTSFEIVQGSQDITFIAPEVVLSNVSAVELLVEASSGLAVELEVLSGPATIDGQNLLLDGTPGTVVLSASQSGDSNWMAAETVAREIEVIEATDELFGDRFEASALR